MPTENNVDIDFTVFAQKIKRKSGLDLQLYKSMQMKRRLNNFKQKKGFHTFLELFNAMGREPCLYTQFVEHLTINVTEFFRNPDRWNLLRTKILPDILSNTRAPKMWSAACSTGEEPYSLVLSLLSQPNSKDFQVLATDLDESVIDKAKKGLYSKEAVANVPPRALKAHFSLTKDGYILKDEIKRHVQFKKHNLLADPYSGEYDLIVCRNVLIYFTDEAKDNIFTKFSRSLVTGGYLFVGGTEQIMQASKYGLTCISPFFYKKM
jgi:chemotaxis protein methyltransferase CheR